LAKGSLSNKESLTESKKDFSFFTFIFMEMDRTNFSENTGRWRLLSDNVEALTESLLQRADEAEPSPYGGAVKLPFIDPLFLLRRSIAYC
jgi:hypothetical protein